MKIAIVHSSFKVIGGAEKVAFRFATYFQSKGHDVHLFALGYGKEAKSFLLEFNIRYTDLSIPLVELGDTLPRNIRFIGYRLRRKLKNFNVINVHNFPATTWLGLSTNFKKNMLPPILWTCHEPPRSLYRDILMEEMEYLKVNPNDLKNILVKKPPKEVCFSKADKQAILWDKRIPEFVDKVICNSYFTASKVEKIYNIKSEVSYFSATMHTNGNNVSECDSEMIHIGAVNRLEISKNIFQMLFALDKLFACRPNLKRKIVFHLIGTGSLKKDLKIVTKKLKLDKVVIFHGFVSESELKSFYEKCRFFLYLPYKEPMGIIPIEAAIFKKPCIVSNSGGVLESVIDNETGWIVDPFDTDKISEKIAFLCENQETCQKIGLKAYEMAKKKFDFALTLDKVEQALMSLSIKTK